MSVDYYHRNPITGYIFEKPALAPIRICPSAMTRNKIQPTNTQTPARHFPSGYGPDLWNIFPNWLPTLLSKLVVTVLRIDSPAGELYISLCARSSVRSVPLYHPCICSRITHDMNKSCTSPQHTHRADTQNRAQSNSPQHRRHPSRQRAARHTRTIIMTQRPIAPVQSPADAMKNTPMSQL
jgi:hypothetical protein